MQNRVPGHRNYSTNINIEYQSKFLRTFLQKSANQSVNEKTNLSLPDHDTQHLLKKSQEVIRLSPIVIRAREHSLRRVQQHISSLYGPMFRVQLFGSTRYGVSFPDSDLDMVILDPNHPKGAPQSDSKHHIKALAQNLRKTNNFVDVFPIPNAKIPIVKFKDRVNNLMIDLNINDRGGLVNTRLIEEYCNVLPILRPMLAFIKLWAKPLQLNNSSISHATFSSYAFALMTIAVLQNMGLLPNLHYWVDGSPLIEDSEILDSKGRTYLAKFRRMDPDTWRPIVGFTLKEALYAWFKYWGTEYPYRYPHVVDVKIGIMSRPNDAYYTTEPISAMRRRTNKSKLILVDPFERDRVITANISSDSMNKFRQECGIMMNRLIPSNTSILDARITDVRFLRQGAFEKEKRNQGGIPFLPRILRGNGKMAKLVLPKHTLLQKKIQVRPTKKNSADDGEPRPMKDTIGYAILDEPRNTIWDMGQRKRETTRPSQLSLELKQKEHSYES
ncbi:hypothetical protein BDP27DRAFT_1323238 [Rhodocollybia butyracea]|uniref:Poly(A) RNA polymerase mitochondrial-like central palm domain-containing protein n=1 Tax=Rhodocollybia butyracea TaxID=206335 RepID=A0A9P5U960_9AGAR|nr:hypothetical protein BDP27DRAFT_1323238 [Rhodocollybia butyracea]